MIRLPRRSVTRFLIPLIDVLTLLFCIFLLMPLVPVRAPGEGAEGPRRSEPDPLALRPDRPAAELEQLNKQVERQRQELERLRREKIETLQERLAIRVLEIDPETGKLFYHDPERVEITSPGQARRLIEQHQRAARGRELFYLFLFPRQLTGFPLERQVQQYDRWFEGVAHGFDNPQAAR
jgi:hypothetical protein